MTCSVGFYQDAVIQPARSENKYLAACKIILHLQKSNILFTNYNERKKKIMEYKKENGTLILGSVEEMRMFANGHITITQIGKARLTAVQEQAL